MKRFIAHRGVLDGDYSNENKIETIVHSLRSGYEVEVDVRLFDGEVYLGHDEPQEKLGDLWDSMRTKVDWLGYGNLWYHCKDSGSMDYFNRSNISNYFFHNTDDFTLTSKGYIWTANLVGCYPNNTIVVAKSKEDTLSQIETNCSGICSPYIGELNNAS